MLRLVATRFSIGWLVAAGALASGLAIRGATPASPAVAIASPPGLGAEPSTLASTTAAPVEEPPPPRPDRCPAPHRDASDVTIARLPDEVTGLAASWFDTRRIAAWNADAVYLSTDEGKTFRRVLDGRGHVAHATFDCFGQLHVARVEEDTGWIHVATTAIPVARRIGQTHVSAAIYEAEGIGVVRLVPYRDRIALIAQDPVKHDRLRIVRDTGNGWITKDLLDGETAAEYGSWDGIGIDAIEPRGRDRIRLLASPWQGGECGYGRYVDAIIDLETLAMTTRVFDSDALPSSRVPRSIPEARATIRDAAGRWLAIRYTDGAVVRRLSEAELARHEREHEAE